MNEDTNIADILKDIALSSEEGKSIASIVKKAQKAAKDGLFFTTIEVSEMDYKNLREYISALPLYNLQVSYKQKPDELPKLTPLMKKLHEMGFTLQIGDYNLTGLFFTSWRYYIRVCWI